uniref:Coiled-coil alpha-helical rod protein 1 n=1 Tax=Vombatus ursinus TaxID=29139 RepID=A0A4X2JYM1_VOMUR
MSRITSVQSPHLPIVLPSPHHGNDNSDHRWEHHGLHILREQIGAGDSEDPKRRIRSLDNVGPQGLKSQSEFTQHLEEMRRLEMESQALRLASVHQKAQLATQAEELEVLGQAKEAMQVEVEELRAALAGAELIRQKLEEGNRQELEETQKLHKDQISHMTEAHQEALATLANKAHELEEKLKTMESKRDKETKELAVVQKEAKMLREELSKAHAELKTQVALVEQLRRYVGDRIPPESKNQTWEQERKQLLEKVQHLQEERNALCTTLELLQVRVQSLQDILALQEEELGRKVQPTNPLESDAAKKAQALLSRWREKVFALMVQLKGQELEHTQHTQKLKGKLLSLLDLVSLSTSYSPPPPLPEEMRFELQQLREERDHLEEELQLSARLIQQEVGRARAQGEEERIRLSEGVRHLEQELQKTQESLAEVGIQLKAARLSQKESTEEAASLRRELTQQQETYGRDLQKKVAEVESRLRDQLSELERRLNEARKEHSKAVVSLRQAQRQAARDKERSQELGRLQEEAQREEGFRLQQRLQELERDKNLMLYPHQALPFPSFHTKYKSFLLCDSPFMDSFSGSYLSALLEDLQEMSEVITREEEGDNGRCSVVGSSSYQL